MSTLSVPLTPEMEKFIKDQVKSGRDANKAAVVRRALVVMSEEEAVQAVLQAEREIAEGKGLVGDLRTLAKKFK